jgi:hypothetical protein
MDALNTSTNKPDKSPKNIPITRIIDLKLKGLSNTEVSKILNCDKSNITYRLNSINFDTDELQAYKDRRADIQAFIQSKISKKEIEFLSHANSKIETWNDMKAASIAKGVTTDKEAMIINNFTQNNLSINAVDDKILDLKRKLASKGIDPDAVNDIDSVIDVDNVDNSPT